MGSQSLRIERLRELATTLNPDCASASLDFEDLVDAEALIWRRPP
jgi:hypothetical protein